MNLTDMRAIVRRDLKDEDSGNYRWTDGELDRHIAHALSELSQAVPVEAVETIATSSGSRDIDISSLSPPGRMVQAVEYPLDKFPKQYQRFSLWANILTLLGDYVPDGSNTRIYYGKGHTLDAETSTLPATLEDLLAVGAGGFACLEWASFSINRVNAGGMDTSKEFEAVGQARLDYFRKELRRLGRNNRVRLSRLYLPSEQPAHQSVVIGP
ncbi:MAG: hypothetical protein C4542_00200 [Dehalococcoidia bacterium]|nr:MAG: hypothetical protein C4542_00200 [Dehalococcoidia bacterium]